jgi:hypothetical protein
MSSCFLFLWQPHLVATSALRIVYVGRVLVVDMRTGQSVVNDGIALVAVVGAVWWTRKEGEEGWVGNETGGKKKEDGTHNALVHTAASETKLVLLLKNCPPLRINLALNDVRDLEEGLENVSITEDVAPVSRSLGAVTAQGEFGRVMMASVMTEGRRGQWQKRVKERGRDEENEDESEGRREEETKRTNFFTPWPPWTPPLPSAPWWRLSQQWLPMPAYCNRMGRRGKRRGEEKRREGGDRLATNWRGTGREGRGKKGDIFVQPPANPTLYSASPPPCTNRPAKRGPINLGNEPNRVVRHGHE